MLGRVATEQAAPMRHAHDGRRDPRCVGARCEVSLDADSDLAPPRGVDLLGVDAIALAVVDADAAQRHLDRLVEPEADLLGRLLDDGVVPRLRPE